MYLHPTPITLDPVAHVKHYSIEHKLAADRGKAGSIIRSQTLSREPRDFLGSAITALTSHCSCWLKRLHILLTYCHHLQNSHHLFGGLSTSSRSSLLAGIVLIINSSFHLLKGLSLLMYHLKTSQILFKDFT